MFASKRKKERKKEKNSIHKLTNTNIDKLQHRVYELQHINSHKKFIYFDNLTVVGEGI